MAQDLFQPPGDFGLSPLISLLPTSADSRQIYGVREALLSRLERIAGEVKKGVRQSDSEYAMLRQALEWLKIDTAQLLAGEGFKDGDK